MGVFDGVKIKKPMRSGFNLSHERKLTCNMGELIPILFEEVVPNDTFQVKSEIFLRFAPMLAPIMHRVDVTTHFFYVPWDQVWIDFNDWITGEKEVAFPTHEISANVRFTKGQPADYLGLPVWDGTTTITNPINFSVLPFRALARIWNEYYRDQDLQNKLPEEKGAFDWATENAIFNKIYRAWNKDYFTSARPWAQKDPDGPVKMPVNWSPQYLQQGEWLDATGQPGGSNQRPVQVQNDGGANIGKLYNGPTDTSYNAGNIKNLTDPQTNINFDINELRWAHKVQQWLERNARAGTRYHEFVLAHYGVRTPDLRHGRPLYLGGGKQNVVISEVLNTSGPTQFDSSQNPPEPVVGTTPQGNMAGHGIATGSTNSFRHFFTEHGCVIGLMSVTPKPAYQNSMKKAWRKFNRHDYLYPLFANMGEQEVSLWEVNTPLYGAVGDSNKTFGYQERYFEYKASYDSVHGDFRDDLEFWHLTRKFSNEPALNDEFIKCNPSRRIFAVTKQDEATIYAQVYNQVFAQRPLPFNAMPML